MTETQALITRFEKELKTKVNLRTNSTNSAEKVLLEAFKYYDLTKSSVADQKAFFSVVKLRMNVSTFNDEELERIWRHYAGTGALRYRDFVSKIFNANVQLSQTEEIDERETKSFTGNKFDIVKEEDFARKILEIIVFKLRQREMSAFLKLYREYVLSAGRAGLSLNHFTLGLKKLGVDISVEDLSQLYNFLKGSRPSLEYHEFCDLLAAANTEERKSALRKVFDRLDFSKTDRVNIGILKELFNPRNHPLYRTGRLTLEEVTAHFEEFLDVWAKLPGKGLVVGAEEFLFLFSFLSAHIKDDKDFFSIMENSFRFNELPRPNSATGGKRAQSDTLSIKSETRPDNILSSVDQQLSKKGNRSYILFYKALKCNDFDADGFIYFKEFQKALKEVRIDLSEAQQKSLFNEFSDVDQKMRYSFILEKLVPVFDVSKVEMIRELYGKLFDGEKGSELSYLALTSAFNSKGHPDCKAGLKADYEIKTEFFDAIQTFLVLIKGTHLSISLYEFVRFFEYFARNWEIAYLASVLTLAFRTRPDSSRSTKNANEESQKSERPKSSALPVEVKINYPFYTNKDDPLPDQKEFKKKDHNMNYPFYVEVKEGEEPGKSTTPIEKSRYEKNQPIQKQEPRDLSPDNGSVTSSMKRSEKAISALNEKLKKGEQLENANPELAGLAKRKLIFALKASKTFAKVLELEYELTNKSDTKGNVDYDVFSVVLETTGLSKDILPDEVKHLFLNSCNREKKFHVQTFANDIRGQMSEDRETAGVQLFDKLVSGAREPLLAVDRLRSSLIPQKAAQKFFKTMSSLEVKESWDYLVDLFVALNLVARKKNDLEMDDFLYFLDNFSLCIENTNDFKDFLQTCFK